MEYPILPALLKRMYWIVSCGRIGYFSARGEVNWKSNTTKYFMRAETEFVPGVIDGRRVLVQRGLIPPVCYFMGVFPNHWNMMEKKITYPHEAGGPYDFPMGSQPIIMGTFLTSGEVREFNGFEKKWGRQNMEYWTEYKKLEGQAWLDFFDSPSGAGFKMKQEASMFTVSINIHEFKHWFMQKWTLEEKRKKRIECLKINYPKPPTPVEESEYILVGPSWEEWLGP